MLPTPLNWENAHTLIILLKSLWIKLLIIRTSSAVKGNEHSSSIGNHKSSPKVCPQMPQIIFG
jgi:hypothetical protein